MLTNYNARYLTEPEIKRLAFAYCGSNTLIDSSVRIIGLENLSLGSNVRIDAGAIIIASGQIRIGSRVHIGANCYLEGRGGIFIEDFANISSFVSVHTVSDDASGSSLTNPTIPEKFKSLSIGEVIIRRHALLFTKCTILPGTVVDEGAVIGAHSLVGGRVRPWSVYAGVPARFKKDRKRDLLALERELLGEEQL